jgi:hypothetical protein
MPTLINRGLILVLDTSITNQIDYAIERLKEDLHKDGYFVTEIEVDQNDDVADVKSKIVAVYNDTVIDYSSALILGHVPVPYSGNLYPDAHLDHQGAWPTDLFYADIDGNWTDQFVNNTDARDPRNHNVPFDGKYDNSTVPSTLELEIGRVDFHSMSQLRITEENLLLKYLDKNHVFRSRGWIPERRGLMDEGSFANSSSDEGFGQSAPRAMIPLVDRHNFFVRDYFSSMENDSYLWSYGQGAGSYTSCNGVGTTRDFDSIEVQSVFTMLFGSYFGDYDRANNLMRASLGSGKILTCSWSSSRPIWYYHHMAMGYPIGFSAKRSVNKENLYNSINFGPSFPTNQGVHNVLLGDPTLRAFYLRAPGRLSSIPVGRGEIQFSWPWLGPQLEGYNLYRRDFDGFHYEKVNDSIITGTRYIDTVPSGRFIYLVRGVALETTATGSYLNEGPGALADVLFRNTVSNDDLLSESILIYPNPTTDQIFVESDLLVKKLTVSDLQGKVCLSQNDYPQSGLDVSSLSPGVYLLMIETEQGMGWKRFVKQ